jgi:hypothetical protein
MKDFGAFVDFASNTIVYTGMEGLLTVCPYVNCLFDSHAKGIAEAFAAAALTPETLINLKLANEPYIMMAY